MVKAVKCGAKDGGTRLGRDRGQEGLSGERTRQGHDCSRGVVPAPNKCRKVGLPLLLTFSPYPIAHHLTPPWRRLYRTSAARCERACLMLMPPPRPRHRSFAPLPRRPPPRPRRLLSLCRRRGPHSRRTLPLDPGRLVQREEAVVMLPLRPMLPSPHHSIGLRRI